MLEQRLKVLGFTENETALYLELIELGTASAGQLSRNAGVTRTTAYSALNSLVERGLATTERQSGVIQYVAGNPESLLRAIKNEKEAILEKEKTAKELVEQIEPFFRSKNFSVPKLRFFEGQKNVENMLYDHLPLWEKSMIADDRTLWGYQDHTFVENYLAWLEWHWPRNKQFDLQVKLFSNTSPVEDRLRNKVARRIIRAFPKEFQFDSSIWVCGDYVIMLVTRTKKHYAFELKDTRFASSLKLIFKLLWSLKLLR